MIAVVIALGCAAAVLVGAFRYGHHFTRILHARTDETLLLGLLGATLLVGIALSGPLQARATALIGPLRDLLAALFFVLFASIRARCRRSRCRRYPLATITSTTKIATSWSAAARLAVERRAQLRAGTALIARGEFSFVIAGLALNTAVESDLIALAGAYVLILAIAGPVLTRFSDHITLPSTRRH